MLSIDESIRTIVSIGSGLSKAKVAEGNSDLPSPSGSYATVLPAYYRIAGVSQKLLDRANENERVINELRGMWSVQFYRENAALRALDFYDWCYSTDGGVAIEVEGLTFVSCTEPNQIDEVISWNFERRWQLNFIAEFRFSQAEREVGAYETFELKLRQDDRSLEEITLEA